MLCGMGWNDEGGKLSNVHFARTAFARQYALTGASAGRSSKLSLGDWRARAAAHRTAAYVAHPAAGDLTFP